MEKKDAWLYIEAASVFHKSTIKSEKNLILTSLNANRRLDAIHVAAREGEVDGLLKIIENGVSVNLRG